MRKVVSYDKDNDTLFIHKGFSSDEKFKGNIDAGELVLDMSTKERVRGVEIINASKFLKVFNVKKAFLENLADAEFNATLRRNSVVVELVFLPRKRRRFRQR